MTAFTLQKHHTQLRTESAKVLGMDTLHTIGAFSSLEEALAGTGFIRAPGTSQAWLECTLPAEQNGKGANTRLWGIVRLYSFLGEATLIATHNIRTNAVKDVRKNAVLQSNGDGDVDAIFIVLPLFFANAFDDGLIRAYHQGASAYHRQTGSARNLQQIPRPADASATKFWMVTGELNGPKVRHATQESALREAERLANLNNGQEFYVLEATDLLCLPKPSAERTRL